jgi:hypothetical protein
MTKIISGYFALLVFFLFSCRDKHNNAELDFLVPDSFPISLKNEHDQLLSRFNKIITNQTTNDSVSLQLNELLTHHFSEEELYVWPLLNQLPITDDFSKSGTDELIIASDRLKEQLVHLNAEHQFIKALLNQWYDGKDSVISDFINDLHQHALVEEQIYYPAAVLVGEYLKLKESTTRNKSNL